MGVTVHSFSIDSLEDPVCSLLFSVLQVPCLVLTTVGSEFLVLRWVRDRDRAVELSISLGSYSNSIISVLCKLPIV